MGLLRQALLLAHNDLRQEVRHLEVLLSALFFTFVVLALFGVGFSALRPQAQVVAVPAMLWLSLAFVGVLALTRLFEREREHDTVTALLVAPVDRLAIYAAKVLVATGVLCLCGSVLVVGLVFLFPAAAPLLAAPAITTALVTGGCLALALVGAVFAAALAVERGRGVLLSLVLYPLCTPILLFALVATRAVLEGHPRAGVYVGQVWALAAVLTAVASLVFESILVPVPPVPSRRSGGMQA